MDKLRVPDILMVVGGLLLILGTYVVIWILQGSLAETGPNELLFLPYGVGGLLLLFLAVGLPLGAIMLAAGVARLYSAGPTKRVLFPLLLCMLIFFAFHVYRLLTDLEIPFLLFASSGFLFVVLFFALVWSWARKRSRLEPRRQKVADWQLGAGISFFSAAWQSCGLTGAPGFSLYPEIVLKLGNQSFNAGQALAVQVFLVFGVIFLLIAMRVD